MTTKTGYLCFVSSVAICLCLYLPVTSGRELHQQAVGYGSPSKEEILWKRLTNVLYDEPELEELEMEEAASPKENETPYGFQYGEADQLPMKDNYQYQYLKKRGRHLNNCLKFKTFGQGYSGLC